MCMRNAVLATSRQKRPNKAVDAWKYLEYSRGGAHWTGASRGVTSKTGVWVEASGSKDWNDYPDCGWHVFPTKADAERSTYRYMTLVKVRVHTLRAKGVGDGCSIGANMASRTYDFIKVPKPRVKKAKKKAGRK